MVALPREPVNPSSGFTATLWTKHNPTLVPKQRALVFADALTAAPGRAARLGDTLASRASSASMASQRIAIFVPCDFSKNALDSSFLVRAHAALPIPKWYTCLTFGLGKLGCRAAETLRLGCSLTLCRLDFAHSVVVIEQYCGQMRFGLADCVGAAVEPQGGRSFLMTPDQLNLVGQASREMNPVKIRNLLDELCHAIDSEHEGLRRLRNRLPGRSPGNILGTFPLRLGRL
jgi:hypothetical protein